mmetsp:Transcript_19635/g.29306  ORF Transcript_19635/g.29306 Transcript_19635/m.29306 type:complete len:1032 (-) Transcript_19635:152-3247(-)
MSLFRNFFGGSKSPPTKPREPTPVDPPPPASSRPQKERGSLFQGLSINNDGKSSTKPKPPPPTSMFSGMNINTGGEEKNDKEDAGGMSAFGFIDGDDAGGADAFDFFGGGGEEESGDKTANDDNTQVRESKAASQDTSAFAFLGGEGTGGSDNTMNVTEVEGVDKEKISEEKAKKVEETQGAPAGAKVSPEPKQTKPDTVKAEAGPKQSEQKEPVPVEKPKRSSSSAPPLFAGLHLGDRKKRTVPVVDDDEVHTVPMEAFISSAKKSSSSVAPAVAQAQKKSFDEPEKDKLEAETKGQKVVTKALSKQEIAEMDLEKVLIVLVKGKAAYYEKKEALDQKADAARKIQAEAEEKLKREQAAESKAIEEERYEAADESSKIIDELTATINNSKSEVQKAMEAYVELEKMKKDSISGSLTGLEESADNFSKLADERASEKTDFLNSTTKRLQRMEDKATADLERVERKLGHVEVDKKHVEEEETDILDVIKKQTSSEMEEKERLDSEAIQIELEVEGLKAKLKQKQAELEARRAAISSLEEKIDETRQGYDRQLKRIAEKRESILKDQREAEGEKDELQTQMQLVKEQLGNLSKTESEFDGGIAKLRACSSGILTLLSALQEEKKIVNLSSKDENRPMDGTVELQAKINKIKTEVKDMGSEKATQEEKLYELSEAIEKIKLALPGLDARKKAAVKRRAFKDAARVNAEIKRLIAEREDSSRAIGKMEASIEDAKSALVAKREELKGLEDELERALAKEDEGRLENIEKLILNSKKQIRSTDKLPKNIQEKFKTILDKQLKDFEVEAMQLRERHGWPEDFKRLEEPEEAVEQSPASIDAENIETSEEKELETADIADIEEVEDKEDKDAKAVATAKQLLSEKKKLEDQQKRNEEEIEKAVEEEDFEKAQELEDNNTELEDYLAIVSNKIAALDQRILEKAKSVSSEVANSPATEQISFMETEEETPKNEGPKEVKEVFETKKEEVVEVVDEAETENVDATDVAEEVAGENDGTIEKDENPEEDDVKQPTTVEADD